MKKYSLVLIVIGIASILLGLAGIWYSLSTLFIDFSEDIPYFYPVFYIMSGICIACYLGLLFCGIQFVKRQTAVTKLFSILICFEIAYFFFISVLWAVPVLGEAVAAATGVATGGMMFQIVTLFFLWAPLLSNYAVRKLTNQEEAPNKIKNENAASGSDASSTRRF